MPFINLVVSHRPDRALARTLAQGLAERTTRILRKHADVTAAAVSFADPAHWFAGGSSLEELGLASFWLDVKVTAGTNTREEKAAFLADTTAFLRGVLGPLHEGSYILVHEVPSDAWGYAGLSQGRRAADAAARAPGHPVADQAGQPAQERGGA